MSSKSTALLNAKTAAQKEEKWACGWKAASSNLDPQAKIGQVRASESLPCVFGKALNPQTAPGTNTKDFGFTELLLGEIVFNFEAGRKGILAQQIYGTLEKLKRGNLTREDVADVRLYPMYNLWARLACVCKYGIV